MCDPALEPAEERDGVLPLAYVVFPAQGRGEPPPERPGAARGDALVEFTQDGPLERPVRSTKKLEVLCGGTVQARRLAGRVDGVRRDFGGEERRRASQARHVRRQRRHGAFRLAWEVF